MIITKKINGNSVKTCAFNFSQKKPVTVVAEVHDDA